MVYRMANILKKLPDVLRAAAGLLTPDNCFDFGCYCRRRSGSRMEICLGQSS